MSEEMRFVVIPVDGEACELDDMYTQSLRYDGLTWEESATLARLSFQQGFTIIIWQEDSQAEGGNGECAET